MTLESFGSIHNRQAEVGSSRYIPGQTITWNKRGKTAKYTAKSVGLAASFFKDDADAREFAVWDGVSTFKVYSVAASGSPTATLVSTTTAGSPYSGWATNYWTLGLYRRSAVLYELYYFLQSDKKIHKIAVIPGTSLTDTDIETLDDGVYNYIVIGDNAYISIFNDESYNGTVDIVELDMLNEVVDTGYATWDAGGTPGRHHVMAVDLNGQAVKMLCHSGDLVWTAAYIDHDTGTLTEKIYITRNGTDWEIYTATGAFFMPGLLLSPDNPAQYNYNDYISLWSGDDPSAPAPSTFEVTIQGDDAPVFHDDYPTFITDFKYPWPVLHHPTSHLGIGYRYGPIGVGTYFWIDTDTGDAIADIDLGSMTIDSVFPTLDSATGYIYFSVDGGEKIVAVYPETNNIMQTITVNAVILGHGSAEYSYLFNHGNFITVTYHSSSTKYVMYLAPSVLGGLNIMETN